jgi:hypothetical protein
MGKITAILTAMRQSCCHPALSKDHNVEFESKVCVCQQQPYVSITYTHLHAAEACPHHKTVTCICERQQRR